MILELAKTNIFYLELACMPTLRKLFLHFAI